MRALFFIVLFISSSALAVEIRLTSGNTSNICAAASYAYENHTFSSEGCNSTSVSDPDKVGTAYKFHSCQHVSQPIIYANKSSCVEGRGTLIETYIYYRVSSCPDGSVPDTSQDGDPCGEPEPTCPTQGTSINLQFAPNVNPTSKGGCGVEQSGDSVCTGTAAEGGYCVAPFSYTGDGIPDDEAVDDSTEWGGEGSPPDPEHTGQGAGTDGSSTSSTGSSSSTSTTTDNGDGTSTTTTTGTSTEETEETSNGTASASTSCGLPPLCSGGDPQLCAILIQEYNSMCSGEQVDPNDFESDLLANGLSDMDQNASVFGTGNTTDIDSDVVSALNAIDTDFSPGSCPLTNEQITFAGVPFTLDVTEVCNFISIMAAIVRVLAGITAAWVLLSGLSRVD